MKDTPELSKEDTLFPLDIDAITVESLDHFCAGTGAQDVSLDLKIGDLLCALMHLSEANDVEFDDCLATARTEYHESTG
jgi:hypothetical protein